MMKNWLFAIFGILPLCFLTGCRSDTQTYPVTGTIHFSDGQPLTSGTIEFETQVVKPAVTARSKVNSDGSFTLATYGKDDGAVAGEHRIAIIANDGMNPIGSKEERPNIIKPAKLHPMYRSLTTSGLRRVVKESKNHFEFTVEYADD